MVITEHTGGFLTGSSVQDNLTRLRQQGITGIGGSVHRHRLHLFPDFQRRFESSTK
ncbi:hypothetical protein [Deinococcus gobiensis]|uniref:Uncharacterized protein n=1 Tax=Deinococcus gobiensis (strain DSM 21396 / JCM 16679 / CGMCC 1.7299 / I-0) TaxID=745776 RepID=H8H1V1_DEIGI|nr:hypothetical protein [Deinococcus gobiensis]AFD27498.1 hypothetical protein DGo_PB0229 [Deinococcus gobiensis I-0]